MEVYARGTVGGTMVQSNGTLHVSSAGTAQNTTVSRGGAVMLHDGAVASDTTVLAGGKLNWEDLGGTAYETTVYSNGYVYGFKYVGAGSTTISQLGGRTIQGTLSSAVVESGSIGYVGDGGKLLDTSVDFGGRLVVYAQGTADGTMVQSNGTLHVSSAGTAQDTTVSRGGAVVLYNGAVASNTTVLAGGTMEVGRNAVATAVTVISGGSLEVSGGGTVNSLHITQGASVTLAKDSYVSFYLPAQDPGTEPLINAWDLLADQGASYTVTVSADQTEGTYLLADGAANFNETIRVSLATGEELGSLTVGKSLSVKNTVYSLDLIDSELSFSISAAAVKSDINGNGVSDVVFQYTGGDYQIGFWLDGTSEWLGQGLPESEDWDVIGAYDMSSDGQADVVMLGNVTVNEIKGAFVGYRMNGDMSSWENISYLTNAEGIDWQVKVGNLTGNDGKNSILWHAPDLGAVGVWTDGTDNWVSLGSGYDRNWKMIGAGDFDGNGKDSILFSYADGAKYYALDIDGTASELGSSDSGWAVRAIGDFSNDGRDDIIAFNTATGLVAKWENGNPDSWSSLGQLDATDWFIAGAGDYNGDGTDDLLVRQYSTGMLGYYADANLSKWTEMGRGVDMNWAVVA